MNGDATLTRCLGVLAAVVFASCGGGSQPPAAAKSPSPPVATEIGPLTLDDQGCTYAGPTRVASGTVVITIVDNTQLRFNLDVWRLNVGHQYAELDVHIKEERRRMHASEPSLGHPDFATLITSSNVGIGSHNSRVIAIRAGTYGFACIPFDTQPRDIWLAGPLEVSG